MNCTAGSLRGKEVGDRLTQEYGAGPVAAECSGGQSDTVRVRLHHAGINRTAENTQAVCIDDGGQMGQERLDRSARVVRDDGHTPVAPGHEAQQLGHAR